MPITAIPDGRRPRNVYGLAAVDYHGRVADRPVIAAWGWTPGMRLNIQEHNGLQFIMRW